MSLRSWSPASVDRGLDALFWSAMLLLVAAAAVARAQGLAPHTLWYDDLVVASVTRLPLWEAVAVPIPTPPGFTAASWMMSRFVAGAELALQIIPFSASVISIVVVGVATRWGVGSRAMGVMAAALATVDPLVGHYAVFVKQFTSEFLAVSVLLAFLAWSRGAEGRGRTGALVTLALFACLVGFGSIVVATLVVNLVMIADSRGRARERRLVPAVAAAAVFNSAVLLYYAVALRGRVWPPLRDYWDGYYVPLGSVGAALRHLESVSSAALHTAFPEQLWWLAWLAPIGLVSLLWRKRTRMLGLVIAATGGTVLVLSALRMYPVGGGRTDIFLHPMVIIAVAAGIQAISSLVPGSAAIRGGLAVAAVGFALLRVPVASYFELDLADHVLRMEARARPAHGIVVYPKASTLAAFYSSVPVVYRAGGVHGLVFEFDRENTLSLLPDRPETGLAQLREFLDTKRYPRIWFLATRAGDGYPVAPLIEQIAAGGYRVRRQWTSRIRTRLVLFEPVSQP